MDNVQKLEHFVAMMASPLTEQQKRYWQNLFFTTYTGMPHSEQVAVTRKYTPQDNGEVA